MSEKALGMSTRTDIIKQFSVLERSSWSSLPVFVRFIYGNFAVNLFINLDVMTKVKEIRQTPVEINGLVTSCRDQAY